MERSSTTHPPETGELTEEEWTEVGSFSRRACCPERMPFFARASLGCPETSSARLQISPPPGPGGPGPGDRFLTWSEGSLEASRATHSHHQAWVVQITTDPVSHVACTHSVFRASPSGCSPLGHQCYSHDACSHESRLRGRGWWSLLWRHWC